MNTNQAVAELTTTRCRCGKGKASGKSFCYFCFAKLDQASKKALYKRVGDGYEEAYTAAVKKLFGVDA